MQSVTTQSPAALSDREDIPVFRVVLVFEDFNTGRRAKEAYDFLVANLTHEWQVTSEMWKFELLSSPELRKMAAKDAAVANLVIVSSRGDRELPIRADYVGRNVPTSTKENITVNFDASKVPADVVLQKIDA